MEKTDSSEASLTFSIITPCSHTIDFLEAALQSVKVAQQKAKVHVEHLVIGDGLSLQKFETLSSICDQFEFASAQNLKVQGGPGSARNLALELSKGELVVFLDADDVLAPDSLIQLAEYSSEIRSGVVDMVAFNWAWLEDRDSVRDVGRREDLDYLVDSTETIRRYLRHQMDGSVIFTAFSRSFLNRHRIRFPPGLHEDVSTIFAAYSSAKRIEVIDETLYLRRSHASQITKRISEAHISDYILAWSAIEQIATPFAERFLEEDWSMGRIGVVASRIKEIVRNEGDAIKRTSLLRHLVAEVNKVGWVTGTELNKVSSRNQYWKIVEIFSDLQQSISSGNIESSNLLLEEAERVKEIRASCRDLQNSIYFAPNEVRTCCKRFFVDGQRRGDVVLRSVQIEANEPLDFKEIVRAKQRLIRSINQGDACDCDNCPFIISRRWEERVPVHFSYLSMEHHSVCNLRCDYCDDTYYGGQQVRYDIKKTLINGASGGHLRPDALIVWGGGEPLIDKQVDFLIADLTSLAPQSRHRFLTNAMRFSTEVGNLLTSGNGSIVTSVDAGSEEVFKKVRGRPGLHKVLANLQSYCELADGRGVTVKYILTQDNSSQTEIDLFCELIRDYRLQNALFQISADFKSEQISLGILGAAILMFQKLRDLDVRFVYIDDLIRQRLDGLSLNSTNGLVDLNSRHVRKSENSAPMTLVGAGQMAHLMLRSLNFRSRWKIVNVVDSNSDEEGKFIHGFRIDPIETIVDSPEDLLIAASQGIGDVLTLLTSLGVKPSRIVRDLVF